ncbi:MAG: DUF177 domain-containing protein [Desulfobulbaceae bacterium]|nr:DUF177 domain-containing protein [Desulfobulbaceae bacterium]
MLQVQTVEIPEEGLSVKVTDGSWFPDREVARRGGLEVEVSFTRRNERISVVGSIDLVMLLSCDRCLADFELPKHIDFQVVFDLSGADPALTAREYECDQSEMDVIFLEDPVIDLGAILSQQVIMEVPRKNLCQNDCQGFCPDCGVDLNKNKCSCEVGDADSPFSVLRQLTTKKN